MTALADELVERLRSLGDSDDAVAKARYLQAFPGGYAEGDEFVGVRVPQVRALARDVRRSVELDDLDALLQHSIHEARLLGAVLVVELYKPAKTPPEKRDKVIELVLARIENLDNWDLVDTVAPHTLGRWLLDKAEAEQDRVLDDLAASPSLWRRRFAMVTTLGMIRAGELRQTFRLAELLVDDEHDLMHKAVGWMLREAGLRDREMLDAFLERHSTAMPRTALRSALEKHDAASRQDFMARRST